MKRIIAILLAAALMLASCAFAETATVLSLSDPVFTINTDEEILDIALEGLRAMLLYTGDGSRCAFEVRGNDERLMRMRAQVDGNRVLFAIDGTEEVYSIEIPGMPSGAPAEEAPVEGEAAPAEGEAAPAEGEAAPAEGEAVPAEAETAEAGIDSAVLLATLMSGIEINADSDPMTFNISYTALNNTLKQLLPLMAGSEIPADQIDKMKKTVDTMIQKDSGIDIDGTLSQGSDGSMAFSANISPVKDGQLEDIAFAASFSIDADNLRLDAEAMNRWIFFMEVFPDFDDQKLNASFSSDGASITVTADISNSEEEYAFEPISTDVLIDYKDMTPQQRQQLINACTASMSGVIGFIYNSLLNTSPTNPPVDDAGTSADSLIDEAPAA